MTSIASFPAWIEFAKSKNDMGGKSIILANTLWESLHASYPGLPEPDAAIGPDEKTCLAFDDGLNHLSFDVMPDGTTEVFYVNRNTLTTDDQEFTIGRDQIETVLPSKVSIFSGEKS